MIPGSASARIEKETESGVTVWSKTAAAADKTEESIAEILGRQLAKKRHPGPSGTRDANSPDAGAMRRHAHGGNVSLREACVKSGPGRCASLRDKGTDIRHMHGKFDARIAPLDGLGNGNAAQTARR